MIFVTVGTHTQSFNRLLETMDKIAAKHKIKAVAQIGHSSYEPKNMEWFRFKESIDIFYENSDVVVCHGGAGSITNALVRGKPVVAVPRYKRFDEHVNDHQTDLVKKLEKEGKITAVYEISNLESAIKSARSSKIPSTVKGICDDIDKFLIGVRR